MVVGDSPASDRQSRTTAKPRATPKPTRPSPRTGLCHSPEWYQHPVRPSMVSVQVSATDPSRTPSGKTQPASQVLLPVGLRRANRFSRKPMTTPVTVSQVTSSRSQNIPAAAGHRRRARRSPGRSPGTTDFASRPGFPHDLGWGPLQTWRGALARLFSIRSKRTEYAPIPLSPTHGSRRAGRALPARLVTAADRRPAFCGLGARRSRRPKRAGHGRPSALVSHTNRGRSGAVTVHRSRSSDLPRRRFARTGGPALGRTRPATSVRAVAGRSCCKTEIPG